MVCKKYYPDTWKNADSIPEQYGGNKDESNKGWNEIFVDKSILYGNCIAVCPLFHFDMYRLRSSDDLFDIGWEDYLDRGGVCAVEWSENVEDAMEDALVITIEKLGEDTRRITLEGGVSLADLSL